MQISITGGNRIIHHDANTILEYAGVALRCVYILVALCSTGAKQDYNPLMPVPANICSTFGHWSFVLYPFSFSFCAGIIVRPPANIG